MLLRPFPTAFAPLFTSRGSILPMIAPQLLSVLLVSGAVVWLHQAAPYYLRDVTHAPFTLFGLALSMFLGLRNNAGYERWWEAAGNRVSSSRHNRIPLSRPTLNDASGSRPHGPGRDGRVAGEAGCDAYLRPD